MEALRRWCHWFVSSHPIQNWATRLDVGAQIPDVPSGFRVLTDVTGDHREVGLAQGAWDPTVLLEEFWSPFRPPKPFG